MFLLRSAVLLLVLLASLSCKRDEQAFTYSKGDAKSTAQRGAAPESATGTDVGSTMPEYAALTLDGAKWDLADKRDKVVLLNLWATWCGPCVFEIPELQTIHEKYASQGFEVVGVSLDESGPEAVKSFIANQKKMTYPVVLDAEGKLANMLQTTMIPTSLIIDRNGRIVWKKAGAIMKNDKELESAIQKAVDG